MTIPIRTVSAFIVIALAALPASAQQSADIDAAARSVVRVVVIEDRDGEAGLGMGSGVAVTPNRIVTNAHVVESAVERGGTVGIIPSEGSKRYFGQVIAYDPSIDLAIIALKTGRIEPVALYSGRVSDGAGVAALGYPAGVDRAMASGVEEVVRPQSPMKSLGHIGGTRTNARFDTVVHDANIGRGNSGGPLVDACGRVVGINSFLSVSEGIDSPFAFALSVRELLPFLKKAGVEPTIVTTPCLGADEASAREASLTQAERDTAALEAKRSESDATRAASEKQQIRDDIASERDNGLALAGALFVLGGVAAIGGMLLLSRRQRGGLTGPWMAIALGAMLALASVVVFLTRPKMSEVADRYVRLHPAKPAAVVDAAGEDGAKICVLDPNRSRVKVSTTQDVSLDWRNDGCVNGKTQYGANAGVWSRTFVPNGEATVTIQSYDPAKARYTVERFLLGADAMDKARQVRARYKNEVCTADPGQRTSVADLEAAVRATLPADANEKLVYDCSAKPAS